MSSTYPVIWSANKSGQSPADMPQIHVAQQVINNMCQGALTYQGEETGEALIGIARHNQTPKIPDLYVLNTIPPVEDAVREWGMFEQGDSWQGAVINWWQENWALYRQLRAVSYGKAHAAKWDSPLIHLGDWHKQPDGMIAPSYGDLRTAKNWLNELNLDYLITPIVTFAHETTAPPDTNTLLVETPLTPIRIDFWWVRRRSNGFLPIQPLVESDASFPRFPPITWWLLDQARSDAEIATLEAAGLQVMDIVNWNTRGHPPLDTCFTLYRQGKFSVYIAITSVNYPQRPPRWRIAPIRSPKADEDFFEALYKSSQEVAEDVFPPWHPDYRLADVVKIIEERLHL